MRYSTLLVLRAPVCGELYDRLVDRRGMDAETFQNQRDMAARELCIHPHIHHSNIDEVEEFGKGWMTYGYVKNILPRKFRSAQETGKHIDRDLGMAVSISALRALCHIHSFTAPIWKGNVVHYGVSPNVLSVPPDYKDVGAKLGGFTAAFFEGSYPYSDGLTPVNVPFASPEELNDSSVPTRLSDIFSMGSTLYALLTNGLGPFGYAMQGVSPDLLDPRPHANDRLIYCANIDFQKKVISAVHRSLKDVNPCVPAEISSVVDAALERLPANRPQNAQETLAVFEKYA